jgi:CheY-like chemotaxis protein
MEALGTLAGGIAHDFNNILGAIVINTELALLDLEAEHPSRAALPNVLQAAHRGKELIKQIITFSRQREWERRPLEVVPVVQEALAFLRSALPKSVLIHERLVPGCGTIQGDPSQIHQVVVNLCQNAALAMGDKGGDLEITLGPVEIDQAMVDRHPELTTGPFIRLTVADSGCGMAPALMERIFEPFFTTRGPGKGSGLGLAVVHGIVRSYHGVITVYSELGKGSMFTVYLPRLEAEAPLGEAPPPSPWVGGGERVLLVEDEPAQLNSLERSLARLGYQVTARADGRSALEAFRDDPQGFDLVITDQTMPLMTGLELTAELLSLRPDLPVILCTGFSEKIGGDAIGWSGIREFAMKPFTLQEIARLIRKALAPAG